jgi:hypothetical protein
MLTLSLLIITAKFIKSVVQMKILILLIGIFIAITAGIFVFVGVSDIGPAKKEITKEISIKKINAQKSGE